MGRRRRKPRLPQGLFETRIDALSHDGRGVARIDGKATFIHGALPGEQVLFEYTGRRKNHDEGDVREVLQASPQRVTPGCAHFGQCGGCNLQHLEAAAQIEYKQQSLVDALKHIGKVEAEKLLPPLVNTSPWGYRRKARLGVKHVFKKGKVLVGFRERASAYVAELDSCTVLHPQVGRRLTDLARLIETLSIHNRLPQIEVAMDDRRCVLIFRVLDEPSADDLEKLRAFGAAYGFIIYLQAGGPESVVPLDQPADLHYALPDFGLELAFQPTDFTQVNTAINRQMVRQAVDLLQLQADDEVLDLFCGVGNFTLPLATRAAYVTGVEGSEALVQRARGNALRNDLHNLEFHVANLYEALDHASWLQRKYHKALIDPPRSGAQEVLPLLPRLGVQRLVYVSCYPGTLARDAGLLLHEYGYRLRAAGVMDMFPHTAHVESMAVFEKV